MWETLQQWYVGSHAWLHETVGVSLSGVGGVLALCGTILFMLLAQATLGRTRWAGRVMFLIALLGLGSVAGLRYLAMNTELPVTPDAAAEAAELADRAKLVSAEAVQAAQDAVKPEDPFGMPSLPSENPTENPAAEMPSPFAELFPEFPTS